MKDPLEQLFVQHKDSVYRFFFRSTRNAHKAEELTQEAFLQAFKGINQFRGDSSLKTWLFKIARNLYLNERKKKSNQLEEHYGFATDEWPSEKDDFQSVDEQLIIQHVFHLMKEEEQTYILLRDFHSFSYAEIAKIISKTEGQVKIGIYRARKKFRKLYQEQEEGIE